MSQPIRVLNIVGQMNQGGIENLIMNIYRRIDRDKVQFDFLVHKGIGFFDDEILSLGGKLYYMPILRDGDKTYYFRLFSYIRHLKEFFANHQEYSIIHGHMTNLAAIYMPISMKYGRVTTLISHSHLTESRPGLSGKITNILHKRIPKIATDFFSCSLQASKWIYPEYLLDQNKVTIIKNGVDLAKFFYDDDLVEKSKMELALQNKIVLGNVARFKKEKNHTFLIDVFNEFHKNNPNSCLILIGDGELMESIKQKVAHLNLQNDVIFFGVQRDVPTFMRAMDVFLLPSLYEGLPLVGIEAQAIGLPVITSTGVTEELNVTGNVSFLELSSSVSCWAKTIEEVLRKHQKEDQSYNIMKHGYDIAETSTMLQNFYISREVKEKGI